MQLCSKPRGARGIEPETFRRRGQLLSRPPTTGPCVEQEIYSQSTCLWMERTFGWSVSLDGAGALTWNLVCIAFCSSVGVGHSSHTAIQ